MAGGRITGTLALLLLCAAACGVPTPDRPTPNAFGSLAAGQANRAAVVRLGSKPARGDCCGAGKDGGMVRCCAGWGGDGRGLRLRLRGGARADGERGAPRDVGAPGYAEEWNMAEEDCGEEKGPFVYEMEVPGTHADLPAAVAGLRGEHRLLVRKGDYRWDGWLEPDGLEERIQVNVTGEKGTRLLGKWILPADQLFETNSCGSFTGVVCAFACSEYLTPSDWGTEPESNAPSSVFTILGGPWNMSGCELRAAAAEVLVLLDRAQVGVYECQMGGMGHLWQMNGTMLATSGVHMADESRCAIRASTIEMCGGWGGSAVRGTGQSKMTVKGSQLTSNVLGVHVNGQASIGLEGCLLKDNHVAHLFAGSNSTRGRLTIARNTFHEGEFELQGQTWYGEDRPGEVIEEQNTYHARWSNASDLDEDEMLVRPKMKLEDDELEEHTDLYRLDELNYLVNKLRPGEEIPIREEDIRTPRWPARLSGDLPGWNRPPSEEEDEAPQKSTGVSDGPALGEDSSEG